MKKQCMYLLIFCSMFIFQLGNCSSVSAKTVDSFSMDVNAIKEEATQQVIPKLAKLEQISPNQIQITYDRDVDVNSAKKVTNYWMQSTKDEKPSGIATLGKNDKVNSSNSLNSRMVTINPMSNSNKTFVLTFNENIKPGMEYKLIICYVIVPGAPPYNGDNGTAIFVGKQ